MNLEKKVAVILCVKDSQDFIKEQIESIQRQSFKSLDIFIGDDGCSKRVLEYLKSYSKKIIIGPKKSFAHNFLNTLAHVPKDYDYYSFCDHDDIWHKDKLERAINELEKFDSKIPNLYCGRTELINKDGSKIGLSPLFKKSPSFQNALIQSIAGGNTMVLNRKSAELLEKAELSLPIVSHDWLTYIFVSGAGGNVVYDSEPSVKYRIHKDNLIGSNLGFKSIVQRGFKVFSGEWKTWIQINIDQINKAALLNLKNKIIYQGFIEMRSERNIFRKIILLKKFGFYRQSILGNVALIFMIVCNRI